MSKTMVAKGSGNRLDQVFLMALLLQAARFDGNGHTRALGALRRQSDGLIFDVRT
jgi:hypothetical protein